MTSVLQPISIATGCANRDGRLVIIDGELVAVIVRLSDGMHGEEAGRWHVEATFDHVGRPLTTFATETEAEAWIVANAAT
jgi:hypothetical protein